MANPAPPGESLTQAQPPPVQKPGFFHGKKLLSTLLISALLFLAYELFISRIFYSNNAFIDSNLMSISARIPGRITLLAVKNHQEVQPGQLLFSIDPTPYQHRLEEAALGLKQKTQELAVLQANVIETLSKIKQAQEEARLASLTASRYAMLYAKLAVSKQIYDEIISDKIIKEDAVLILEAEKTRIDSQITLQKVLIEQAKVLLNLAEYQLSLTNLSAPGAGTVNNLYSHVGDQVSVEQALFGITPTNDWFVTANFNEKYFSSIQPGQPVLIYLAANPWHLYWGNVTSKGNAVSRTETTQTAAMPYIKPVVSWIRYPYLFPVTISFKDPPKELYKGSDVRVWVLKG